jgi:nicotinate-nucleotide adenylyltransferase
MPFFRMWLEHQESKCYFFGTFDPIHNDHIAIATKVASYGHVIVFVPAGESPDKVGKKMASHVHRVNMCRIIADKYGWIVEDIEGRLPQPNISIHTLRALEPGFDERQNRIPFILGSDNLKTLHTWDEAPQLAKKLTIYAADRGMGQPKNDFLSDMDVKVVETQRQGLSATMIRNAVQKGEPIGRYVDPDVALYIKQNGLYQ